MTKITLLLLLVIPFSVPARDSDDKTRSAFTVSFLPQNLPVPMRRGPLESLNPVGYFSLPAGAYAISGTVDFKPTAPAQHYVCELTADGRANPLDITPPVYALAVSGIGGVRLPLNAVAQFNSQARLVLSCSSDAEAQVVAAKFSVVEVGRIGLPIAITPSLQ